MRTKLLFDNVSAGVAITSEVVDFDEQDARFLLHVKKTGADGSPRVIIEESLEGTVWSALEDTETWQPYTEIDQEIIAIKDNYFMGKYLRVRLEPNGTTAGTIWALLGYKTKP